MNWTAQMQQRPQGRGVQLAIDDFGTGHSSLAYLRRLPIDVLKIDKAFVDGVATNPEAAALAAAIIKLAGTLSLRPVAEGIEHPAQLQRLRDLRCHYGQGYHFAKPLDEQQLAALLRAHQPGDQPLAGDQPLQHSPVA